MSQHLAARGTPYVPGPLCQPIAVGDPLQAATGLLTPTSDMRHSATARSATDGAGERGDYCPVLTLLWAAMSQNTATPSRPDQVGGKSEI